LICTPALLGVNFTYLQLASEIHMNVDVRPMELQDMDAIAHLHGDAFQRQFSSHEWVACNFQAYPRIMIFVALEVDVIVGYIQWIQKSGFRKEAVIELEQIAVLSSHRQQQIGTQLIKKSMPIVNDYLQSQGSLLKTILVTTRTDNSAQILYKNALGAEIKAIIKDLYSHDEVIMVANYVES
jgi:ribosomal protein S18 acetylase RimI-like enzyme